MVIIMKMTRMTMMMRFTWVVTRRSSPTRTSWWQTRISWLAWLPWRGGTHLKQHSFRLDVCCSLLLHLTPHLGTLLDDTSPPSPHPSLPSLFPSLSPHTSPPSPQPSNRKAWFLGLEPPPCRLLLKLKAKVDSRQSAEHFCSLQLNQSSPNLAVHQLPYSTMCL